MEIRGGIETSAIHLDVLNLELVFKAAARRERGSRRSCTVNGEGPAREVGRKSSEESVIKESGPPWRKMTSVKGQGLCRRVTRQELSALLF